MNTVTLIIFIDDNHTDVILIKIIVNQTYTTHFRLNILLLYSAKFVKIPNCSAVTKHKHTNFKKYNL